MSTIGSVSRSPRRSGDVASPPETTNLADLLERVLDKGVVIAGDITLFLGGVQLLTLKIRLLVASIDKAQEIGINWWQFDPALSLRASARTKDLEQSENERNLLTERLDRLERLLLASPEGRTAAEGGLRGVLQEADQKRSPAGQRSNAAAAYVLDPEGRLIAELKQRAQQPPEEDQPQTQKRAPQPVQQLHEEEQPQAQERAPQLEAAQAEQAAGAGPVVGQTLHERIAQAMRPVLEELRQRNAQATQSVEQGRPAGHRGAQQPQEDEQPQALERAPQPQAAQTPAPARVLEEAARMSAEPTHSRVNWRLAVVDLDRESGGITELEQPRQQAQEADQPQVQEPAAAFHATAAHFLDPEGRMIAELKQPAQQLPEEELEAEQTEQPAGGGQLLGPALQQRIALAFRPVLGVAQLAVQLGIVQAPQLMGHGRREGQQRAEQPHDDEQHVALAAVLDHEGRVIAELKPLHEQERPQTQER